MMEKYILITGASSGIGEATAIELSEEHRIILSGRNIEKLKEVQNKCHYPQKHLLWRCDLDKDRLQVYTSLNSLLTEQEISVKAFVHCAGMTKILPIKNFQSQYVDQIFNTNVFSAIEVLRSLLRKNNRKYLKNILFISALWSIRGDVGNSVYAASKGALNALVYSLSRELAPEIRVNAISPGAVLTPMTIGLLEEEEFRTKIEKEYPLGIGHPTDIVNSIQFLLSEKARWITGQNYVIDGGRSTL